MQIPMLTNYKKIFGDLESFHVNGVCLVNQFLNSKLDDKSEMSKDYYLEKYIFNKDKIKGINAMSISDISGIPRPTVIRKLKKLIKENYLKIDLKKHYTTVGNKKILVDAQKNVFINLAIFTSKFFNLFIAQNTKS